MWTTKPARRALCLSSLVLSFCLVPSAGAADGADLAPEVYSLALGKMTGTVALREIQEELCPSPLRTAPGPGPVFLPTPPEPGLDLIRIPDGDGAGGDGQIHWIRIVDLPTSNLRQIPAQTLPTCDRAKLVTACGTYRVEAHWSPAPNQGAGYLDFQPDGQLAGRLPVKLRVVATSEDGTGGTLERSENLMLHVFGDWSSTGGPDVVVNHYPFTYDSDCDGLPDQEAPPTAPDHYLGWRANGNIGSVCMIGRNHMADICWEPARSSAEGNP